MIVGNKLKMHQMFCDGCNIELNQFINYKNGGSYHLNYISLNNLDLCFHCAGKILDNLFSDGKINEEEIREMLKKEIRL